MTRKEMDRAIEATRKMSPEVSKAVRNEISTREMIMSCLIYGHGNSFYNEETGLLGKYGKSYCDMLKITEEEAKRLYFDQKAEFEAGTNRPNTYTDCEGLTYNTFFYRDEAVC